MDVPVASFVLLMQQRLFPTTVFSLGPFHEFKSAAGELTTAIIIWTGSSTMPWYCEDAKLSQKACKDGNNFLRRALQRSTSIKRLESRSQRTKESVILSGHQSNGWLQIDGETAILMAGDQRAEKSSPVQSLCLCNPKAYVTTKEGRRLVSYNKISVHDPIQSDGQTVIPLAGD